MEDKAFKIDNNCLSSSLIRQAIDCHDMEKVTGYLGHPHFAKGQVIHGKGRGKTIGIPTTNLAFSQIKKLPPRGVYFSQIIFEGKKSDDTQILHRPPAPHRQDRAVPLPLWPNPARQTGARRR